MAKTFCCSLFHDLAKNLFVHRQVQFALHGKICFDQKRLISCDTAHTLPHQIDLQGENLLPRDSIEETQEEREPVRIRLCLSEPEKDRQEFIH